MNGPSELERQRDRMLESCRRRQPIVLPQPPAVTIAAAVQAMDDALTTWSKAFSADLERIACSIAATQRALGRLVFNPAPPRRLVVDDPAMRWVSSYRELARQLVDIVRHEVAMAQGRPERSPGARWERT